MGAVARLGRVGKVALTVALVWSTIVLVGGYTLPLYSGEVETSSGVTVRTDTLVGANGSQVVVVLLVPLLVSALVAAVLAAKRLRGAIAVAWSLTAVLCLLTALALLTIGIFLVPVAAALVLASGSESLRRLPEPAGLSTGP